VCARSTAGSWPRRGSVANSLNLPGHRARKQRMSLGGGRGPGQPGWQNPSHYRTSGRKRSLNALSV
jgi:hypothetical protein